MHAPARRLAMLVWILATALPAPLVAQDVPDVNDVYASGTRRAVLGPRTAHQNDASAFHGGTLRYDFRLTPFGAATAELPKLSGSVLVDLEDPGRPPRFRAVIDGRAAAGGRVTGTLVFDGREYRFDALRGKLGIDFSDLGTYLLPPLDLFERGADPVIRAHDLADPIEGTDVDAWIEVSPAEMGHEPPWRVLHRVDGARHEHLYLAFEDAFGVPAEIERLTAGATGELTGARLVIDDPRGGPRVPADSFTGARPVGGGAGSQRP